LDYLGGKKTEEKLGKRNFAKPPSGGGNLREKKNRITSRKEIGEDGSDGKGRFMID
jgi:hypothetical protein